MGQEWQASGGNNSVKGISITAVLKDAWDKLLGKQKRQVREKPR